MIGSLNSEGQIGEATPTHEAAPSKIADKWEGAVTQGSGWVAIPMSLLRLQSKFELTATDMVVLTNLLAHWWDPARAVYPRSTIIAQRMGVTKRTVQRSIQRMLDKSLIRRVRLEDGKRAYRFDSLVAKLDQNMLLSYQLQGKERLDA